jgi:dTMP kinase
MTLRDDLEGAAAAEPRVLKMSMTLADTKAAGRFFVFEGIDGSGKSTVSRLFAERLASTGRPVEWTAEPTSGWLGDQVRRANKEAHSAYAETLLYVADRAEHTAQMGRWLAGGRAVVCDRYVGSTLAYQSVTLRPYLGSRALEWLKMVNEPLVVRPDVTFLLRIDPVVALARLSKRKEREKFEKVEFLHKVAAMYDRLAEEDPSYIVVDASLSLDEVLDKVWSSIVRT